MNRSWSLAAVVLGLGVAAATSGCGSATTGGSTGESIALSLTPAAGTVQVGGTIQLSGSITRGGGFAGAVAVSVEGAPAGVTGTVDSGSVTSTAAVVRISASPDALPGTYQLTVRAKATGLTDATSTFSLTISPATTSFYTLTVDASPLAVTQGAAIVTAIVISRRADFAGTVTFSAEGLPVGITAAFNPTQVVSVGSTLTFTVGSTVLPGTYPVIVRGTATGQTDVTAHLTLVVGPAPTFSIAVGTHFLNMLQGVGGQTYIKATRSSGFTAAASYTVTGAPAGLTATVVATAVADSLTLGISTLITLVAGSYPLVVHANAAGVLEQTAIVTVTVAGTAGVNVRLDFSTCPQVIGVVESAIWVAYQDGTGPWTQVVGAGAVYTFHVNSASGGIAVVRHSVQFYTTSVQYLTQAELQSASARCGDDVTDVTNPYPGGTKTLNGTLTQLAPGDFAQVAMGSANSGPFGIAGPATTYQLTQVLDGLQDLLAYRSDFATNSTRQRMVVRRDQNVADGGAIDPIDFDGAEAFVPVTASFPVTGTTPGNGSVVAYLDYLSGASCTPNRFTVGTPSGGALAVFGVPAAQQRVSDYHALTLTDDGNFTGGFRYVRNTFHLFAARTVALGSGMPTAATVTQLTGAYRRLQATFAPPSDYATAGLYYHDGLGHIFEVSASGGYRGQLAATLVAPDLSGVTGYATALWAPSASLQVKIFGKTTTQTSACSEGITTYADQVVSVGP